MKRPGTYYNPAIEYTEETEFLRGRPLVSSRLEFLIQDETKSGPRERIAFVEFLKPKRSKKLDERGLPIETVRLKLSGAVFSLAVITPRQSKESYVDAMLEDFKDVLGFEIPFGSGVALPFLKIDMAARCGNERFLEAAAAAELGIFFRRFPE